MMVYCVIQYLPVTEVTIDRLHSIWSSQNLADECIKNLPNRCSNVDDIYYEVQIRYIDNV